MEFSVRASRVGTITVLRFAGRMVLGHDTTAATDWMRALISQNHYVVIDLNGLMYADPSGIGSLLSLYTSASRIGTRLHFVRPSHKIARLLESTKLTTVFPIYDSEEAAIAAFAPLPGLQPAPAGL